MSVLQILKWIMTSNNIITACVLIMFASSLLFLLLRGAKK